MSKLWYDLLLKVVQPPGLCCAAASPFTCAVHGDYWFLWCGHAVHKGSYGPAFCSNSTGHVIAMLLVWAKFVEEGGGADCVLLCLALLVFAHHSASYFGAS